VIEQGLSHSRVRRFDIRRPLPEMIFVIVAAILWRKRKTVSAGILACAVMLGTHFLIYVSAHG